MTEAKQQEIVTLFFVHGARVRWYQPTFNAGQVGVRLAEGRIVLECATKPGIYYVRDDSDNRLYLVMWSELERIALGDG